MAVPIWDTPYNLGSFYSNIPINIQLLALPIVPATSIVYSLLSGTLPNGLTLSSNGYISGTIANPNSNANFTITIIVNATDNLGNQSSKSFILNFINSLTQPNFVTPAGSLGVFPALIEAQIQLIATTNLPAVSVTYQIISGTLPNGMSLTEDGLIFGTPDAVNQDVESEFVIRVTDNYGSIRDRTFTITISGAAVPTFVTPQGNILSVLDSIWVEKQIQYNNPITTNPIRIRIVQGALPPGLELNSYGIIRGYPQPPVYELNLPLITTSIVQITDNVLTALSTSGFRNGRPIIFSGTTIGDIALGQVYFVKRIISNTEFTITTTVNGPELLLDDGTGFIDAELPITTINQPTKKTYSFTTIIESPIGSNLEDYNIVVTNQNMPTAQGGPGYPENTRTPTLYNTRPPTFDINFLPNFGYYLLPLNSKGLTYPTTSYAYIGQLESDNYFSFQFLGHDFDGNALVYTYNNLPLGITGDTTTGWVTGTPVISDSSISEFTFQVSARKSYTGSIVSPIFSFSFKLANNISDLVIWETDNNLGIILNGSISALKVNAVADVPLSYRLVNGSLPPNLSLLSNGEITGQTAWQPSSNFVDPDTVTTFTFTIEAYSPTRPIISNSKTFTVDVINEFNTPCDVLYIQATPSLLDRNLLRSLLENNTLIPYDYLYRPTDPSFGKATSVVYAHAYGIDASSFDQYIAAVTKNHYWRNITLGSISTAVAKDTSGNIIYEVVYSNVIDNLINPQGVSVSQEVVWPRRINLNKGPWYTSSTDIFTSYIFINPNDINFIVTENENIIITENDVSLQTEEGFPTFYTSLTPGYVRTLYPNSLPNMRNRVGQVLGVQTDFRLLPKWMTSQQNDGNTLGYIPAWVICYTKPGFSEIIKNNIQNNWKNEVGQNLYLNQINFKIDRFTVDKSSTYNYVNTTSPPGWLTYPSASPVPDPINSKDFYVLFPRQTILPDDSQYS